MQEPTARFSGESAAVRRLEEQIRRQTRFSYPLLLQGERGSGKRRAARWLRQLGPWRDRPVFRAEGWEPDQPFPDPETLRREGGFVLLEEVDRAPGEFQDACLRWLSKLEEAEPGVRIVSTSEAALGQLAAVRRFRPDLYLRLRIGEIHVPPLRERKEDIPFLVREFLEEAAVAAGELPKILTAEAMDVIFGFPWPGNVAQLRAEILRAVAATPGNAIPKEAFRPDWVSDPDQDGALCVRESLPLSCRMREYERQEVLNALRDAGENRDRAAEILGIDRRTLQRKLRRWRREPAAY